MRAMVAISVPLTRDECRKVADALRAAALREPFEFGER